ncbi:Na(+)/H(+) antiporter subunit B [Hyphobacterium sp.]|uniref:Na(+)/H(+) antiporter subunit B n=1 Tax=Hyphobacterium sp. TaxID=2004662 RepID=UPI003BAC6690
MNPYLILRVVSKLLIPIIVVYGLYVHFHGEYSPGGGFQAGTIVAAGVILYALIFGVDNAKRAVPPTFVKFLGAFGVLLYGGTGVASLLLGANYLDYDALHPDQAHKTGQLIGIIVIELGVLTTVFAVMMMIFYAFASRAPDIPEEEWK